MHVGSSNWKLAPPTKVSLNRTPPLFDTDEPTSPEISSADVRVLRAGGRVFVQLSWHDKTRDATTLEPVPDSPPEKRFRKVPTESDDRFFDAAAVMVPVRYGVTSNPSLQMGDPGNPVHIYYWNAARGAMLMEAQGRSTTRRTGISFSAAATFQNEQWTVTFEMPDQPAGTPMAFAIWNGSQNDRDGRKYFSVWYRVE
jgi:Ethylbenzene dehydrogenase